ncbi:hypothetical protein Nepgr_004268 [Nepenthes gracilis]|uniref:Uncharacterized protein n=1 Tax=Nepenthes gracilis TaxID=150966 RepID=A0AAD3XEV7_NEPGR|nr:hypothetical protein Nepgr_004268 [Nepenthes gracilis]
MDPLFEAVTIVEPVVDEQVLNRPDTEGILGYENEDEEAVAMVEDSPSGIGTKQPIAIIHLGAWTIL